jgi:hypothetical protein
VEAQGEAWRPQTLLARAWPTRSLFPEFWGPGGELTRGFGRRSGGNELAHPHLPRFPRGLSVAVAGRP